MQVSEIRAAARSVGQEINILNARTVRDIDAAFAMLAQMRANALLVAADPLFYTRVAQLVVLSARNAIPTLYSRREFTAAGGLMSYGPKNDEAYRLIGLYAARGNLCFLVTNRGEPYTAPGFGNWFRKLCDKAGCPDVSAHGLRKATARRRA
jgi:hypothetical protein